MSDLADEIAGKIDHTLLKPEATPEEIDALCEQALSFGFAGVCVNPIHVSRAACRLSASRHQASGVGLPAVVSVVGFPLGGTYSAIKADEARRVIGDGATEIDMVAALGALCAGDDLTVRRDIEAVAGVVHQLSPPGILKVILETSAINEKQIILGCRCCTDAGADFVKTSTGFHPAGGATVEHVRLLARHASPLKVKAAGGIRTPEDARMMIAAGAARLGTSAGVAIIQALPGLRP